MTSRASFFKAIAGITLCASLAGLTGCAGVRPATGDADSSKPSEIGRGGDAPPNLRLSSTLPSQTGRPSTGTSAPLPTVEIPATPQQLPTIDLTAEAEDVFQRIRNGFAMPDINNDLVLYHQQWYLNRPDYLRRMVERSSPYLHHIVEEIEKRGMPMELALLPMVESAYNAMAYSRAKASGLWQFIPATGRRYNLDQNWWKDERRDIVASTAAALEYLQSIYDMHGDWHLALASYNWGEGAVKRAIEKNEARGLPTDYPNLTMPKETRHYVPKLQALTRDMKLNDLPYKVVHANPARTVLNLCIFGDAETHIGRRFFQRLIDSNPDKLKLARELKRLSGMSRALRNLYTYHLFNTPLYLSKNKPNRLGMIGVIDKPRPLQSLLSDSAIDKPFNMLPLFQGELLKLGPTEFKLLNYLMKHPERVHSRAQLLDKVWGDHVFIEERTVDVHVKRLREALGAASAMVETVRGAGYRLTAQPQLQNG